MADYRKMYALLVRAASTALDELPNTKENFVGRGILQAALYAAEDLYIDADEKEEEPDT